MATIYRFIVENQTRASNGRKNTMESSGVSKKTTAKGKWVSILSSPKGGVEHNRKMRAINPLLNKMTGGYWEKGMRVGRAGMGLVQTNTETGKIRIGGVGFAILIAFLIQSMLKFQRKQMDIASKKNTQNFKSMETGISQVHGEYSVSRNYWNGYMTYNENK